MSLVLKPFIVDPYLEEALSWPRFDSHEFIISQHISVCNRINVNQDEGPIHPDPVLGSSHPCNAST
jgi:hypothetical protein